MAPFTRRHCLNGSIILSRGAFVNRAGQKSTNVSDAAQSEALFCLKEGGAKRREIFEKYYPGQGQMIADFWMPNKSWEGCDVDDPSARVLSNYGDSGK